MYFMVIYFYNLQVNHVAEVVGPNRPVGLEVNFQLTLIQIGSSSRIGTQRSLTSLQNLDLSVMPLCWTVTSQSLTWSCI